MSIIKNLWKNYLSVQSEGREGNLWTHHINIGKFE